MNRRQLSLFFALFVLILGVPVLRIAAHLLTESWWFASVGFESIFATKVSYQILFSVVTFLSCLGFLGVNYRWAIANHPPKKSYTKVIKSPYVLQTRQLINLLVTLFFVAVGVIGGFQVARDWEIILKSAYAVPFNIQDPIFNRDLSVFVLKMPFYEKLIYWAFELLCITLMMVTATYGFLGEILLGQGLRKAFSSQAKLHLSVLGVMLSLLGSGFFWLARYHFLSKASGVVYGASYTDVHADIWIYQLLSIMAIAVAGLFGVSAQRRQWRLPAVGIGGMLGVWVILHGGYAWVMQHFFVSPNELVKEKPYLTHNIQYTQAAYKLDQVTKLSFEAESDLDQAAIAENEPTISNIRLWDYRPILSTYRQLQEIRLYYKFSDVDVDRYTLNGKYQQVMLSAREFATDQLPPEARTWVNQRLKYTHGYGLAMSPVNQTTADGLPEFYIQDIPPQINVDLSLKQPAIYYGEETKSYVFTGTKTDEFDYPQGQTNAFTRYEGKGGIPIPTVWHRLLYAIEMGDSQILTSNYFTNQSRIHDYRQIVTRVRHIAPFLRFDNDPYLIVLDGKLNWIIDAYTVSDRYPYSESLSHLKSAADTLEGGTTEALLNENINYIRNSVKIVINAFDGSLKFYGVDKVDPILATYRAIFPKLFADAKEIAPELKAHFRYPEDLFRIQTQMYLTYHMSDPEEFYNREDLWRLPYQTYERSQVVMQPYYMVMPLSSATPPEFIQIQPFTPANKDNMISWLAARVDGANANLLLYDFPKQKLVYGPRQIEARIDQNPAISQAFTLWSQAGSRVIRGDLLVIPVNQSLLYVEPIYLRAEQGELPELKRVVVCYDKSIAMEDTLEAALASIFGVAKASEKAPASVTPLPTAETSELELDRTVILAKESLALVERAEEALRQGKWTEYGRYQQELKTLLDRNRQPAESSSSAEDAASDAEESGIDANTESSDVTDIEP